MTIHLAFVLLCVAFVFSEDDTPCSINIDAISEELWIPQYMPVTICCGSKEEPGHLQHPHRKNLRESWKYHIRRLQAGDLGRYECLVGHDGTKVIVLRMNETLPVNSEVEERSITRFPLNNITAGLYWLPAMMQQAQTQNVRLNDSVTLLCSFIVVGDYSKCNVDVKWNLYSLSDTNKESLLLNITKKNSSQITTEIENLSCPHVLIDKKHLDSITIACCRARLTLIRFTLPFEGNYSCSIHVHENDFESNLFWMTTLYLGNEAFQRNHSSSLVSSRSWYTRPPSYTYFKELYSLYFPERVDLLSKNTLTLECTIRSDFVGLQFSIYKLNSSLPFNTSETNNTVLQWHLQRGQLVSRRPPAHPDSGPLNNTISFIQEHASVQDSGIYACVTELSPGLYTAFAASQVHVSDDSIRDIICWLSYAVLAVFVIAFIIYEVRRCAKTVWRRKLVVEDCVLNSTTPSPETCTDQTDVMTPRVNYLPAMHGSGTLRSSQCRINSQDLLSRPPLPLKDFPTTKTFDNLDGFLQGAQDGAVTLRCRLFAGEFGSTYRATVKLPSSDTDTVELVVVAKVLKEDFRSHENFTSYLSMVQKMKELPQHGSIIRLLGLCYSPGSFMMLTEYAPGGTLLSQLHSLAQQYGSLKYYINLVESKQEEDAYLVPMLAGDSRNHTSELNFSGLKQLLFWLYNEATQLADAMDLLSTNKIIHGNLAAVNILVGENRRVKLKDLGGPRASSKCKMTRWMSPERLENDILRTAGDIWSFGVLLWEMFSLGSIPYPELEDESKVRHHILMGYRLSRPLLACDTVFAVMRECCQTGPADRPIFSTIRHKLGNASRILMHEEPEHVPTKYLEMNCDF